jgi:hypothetical protein
VPEPSVPSSVPSVAGSVVVVVSGGSVVVVSGGSVVVVSGGSVVVVTSGGVAASSAASGASDSVASSETGDEPMGLRFADGPVADGGVRAMVVGAGRTVGVCVVGTTLGGWVVVGAG